MEVSGVTAMGHDLLLDGHGAATCHLHVPLGRVELPELEILAKQPSALAAHVGSVRRRVIACRGGHIFAHAARVARSHRRPAARSSGWATGLARTAFCASGGPSAGS